MGGGSDFGELRDQDSSSDLLTRLNELRGAEELMRGPEEEDIGAQ